MYPKLTDQEVTDLAAAHPGCPQWSACNGAGDGIRRSEFIRGFLACHRQLNPPGGYSDGEVVWQGDLDGVSDDKLVVEADGKGGGDLMIVRGNYPVDYTQRYQRHFHDVEKASEMANALNEDEVTRDEAFDEKYTIPDVRVVGIVMWRYHPLGHLEFWLAERISGCFPGMFGDAGGKVEEGESYEEAAFRELREETGLEAEALQDSTVGICRRPLSELEIERMGKTGEIELRYYWLQLPPDVVPLQMEPTKLGPWKPYSLGEINDKKMPLLPFLEKNLQEIIVQTIFPGSRPAPL